MVQLRGFGNSVYFTLLGGAGGWEGDSEELLQK